MAARPKALRLRQVDQRLKTLNTFRPPPPRGWIRAIREALGMSTTQLARRLGIAQSNVVTLEQREALGTVTLDSLSRAAIALDCQLVYAIVPRDSLQAIRERRARIVARDRLSRIAHSMALEDQAVPPDEQQAQEDQLVQELLATWPRTFWDDPPTGQRRT
jgi:predicted DNA-binding mobile mystery protein A